VGIFICLEDGNQTITSGPTTTAGTTSAWTQKKNLGLGAVGCRVYLYTATVSAAGSITVSYTPSASCLNGSYIFAYPSNCAFGDTGSKDPTGGAGSSVTMDTTTTANYTLDSLTTTVANAAIEFIAGDWTANATNPTAGERRETDAGTMTYLAHYPGDTARAGFHGGYYPDAGAAGTKIIGFSTLRKPTVAGIEIQGPSVTPANTGYGDGSYGTGSYGDRSGGDTTAPVINVSGVTATRVSRVAGKDATDVSWTTDEAFVEYEIRKVGNASDGRGAGTQVETATVTSRSSHTVTITDDELVAASAVEGSNLLKVFVKDAAGNWST
jgi:hypothetical protein